MTTHTATKTQCPGSGLPGTAVHGNVYPHCPLCGREFGAQGRKAQARLGNPWVSIPVHFNITDENQSIRDN